MQPSKSDFNAVTTESGLASGLPNHAYTSEDFFRMEQEQLFARTWTCIGNGCNIPEPGDLQPIGFLGQPLVMLRNRQGAVKVFHNVCSHRGNELVWQACSVKRTIQCPYHGWAYDLDGRLLATPNVGGSGVHSIDDLDRNEHGLCEARSAVWMDLVFVNLSADAPDFETFIAPLQQRIDKLLLREKFTALKPAANHGSYTIDFAGNWKLCIENNLESYHLPTVHPDLNAVSKLEDHYHFYGDDLFAGQGTLRYDHEKTNLAAFPVFDGWSDMVAEYPTLYPNVFLGFQADHFWTRYVQPVSAERSLDHLQIYYLGDAADSPEFEAARAHRLEVWAKVFNEDIGVVEGMQRGRHSSAFSGGVFTPIMDKPSHHFAKWVARQLTSDVL
ncbi:MAG: aromatic ring-hydroxylating dioxygenase subunit alpha [Gammaproteobacteria bacterium]|nr:aromatic ring-hydroxylating dioxygenase subunit alpha [Gammaproteobacteria bacterium]